MSATSCVGPLVPLRPHPAGAQHARMTLGAAAERRGGGVELRFCFEGDLEGLVLLPPSGGGRRDGLWRHTCCEAFARRAGEDAYLELNLAPSGDWAAYRFDGYRTGGRDLDLARPPRVATCRGKGRLEVAARVEGLPARWGGAEVLQVGLAAVVETGRGRLSYWALAHPEGRPDFHHPAGFRLELRR